MTLIDAPFETIVRPEVFNPQHEFDAKLVADALEVSIATIANAIGKPADTVRKRKNAPGLQDGLGHLALIYSDLIAVHAGDRTAAMRWFNTPNRALKNRERPRTLLERGQLDVLEALVDSLKRRQPL
jgi:hypothetical protein